MKKIHCDGFCQRCSLQESCSIFQEKFDYQINCLIKGKDFDDSSSFFEKIYKRLEKILEKKSKISEYKEKELTIKIKKIKEDELFKKIKVFVILINKLLKKILDSQLVGKKQFAILVLQEDLENILHYGRLVELKIYESLYQEKKETQLKNIALSYFSLIVCQEAINNFLIAFDDLCSIECLLALEKISDLKKEIIKKCPTVNKSKDKIIFNTQIDKNYLY